MPRKRVSLFPSAPCFLAKNSEQNNNESAEDVERPILFSGPMVRAILEGRKTQTRRLVKPQPEFSGGVAGAVLSDGRGAIYPQHLGAPGGVFPKCPYGQPGDRLWVKETWFHPDPYGVMYDASGPLFRADGDIDFSNGDRWRPSIYMPRWASRITLEIVSVRVERLQNISHADCLAEGIIKLPASGRYVLEKGAQYFGNYWTIAAAAYRDLWQSINGPESWDANPWVWVIEFKRVEA